MIKKFIAKNKVAGFRRIEEELEGKKQELERTNIYIDSVLVLLANIAEAVEYKTEIEPKSKTKLATYTQELLAEIEEKRRETVSAAEAKLREAAKVEEQKLIKTEARLEELKEIATALEKEKSELEMSIHQN